MLALFVSHLHARKLAPSTIKSYLSAIGYVHKLKGLRDPTRAFIIDKLLTALSRQSSSDIRLPISRPVLHALVGSLNHNNSSAFHRTLFSMFLIAFYVPDVADDVKYSEICNKTKTTVVDCLL